MGSMKAFASAIALFAASGAWAQAQANLKPAKIEEVVAATQACRAAAFTDRIDEGVLRNRGWQPGTLAVDGRPASGPFRVYGRQGGNALIMLASDRNGQKLCSVVAGLSRLGDFGKVGVALSTSLGAKPAQLGGGTANWLSGGKLVNMQATGSRERPSIRVSVAAVRR